MKIKCQRSHGSDNGCSTCGGYGVVLVRTIACKACKKKAWFKPGVHTVYDGKQYTSTDGLELVWRTTGTYCRACDLKKVNNGK